MTPFYEQGGITIYCGDCLEVMQILESGFDAAITDPPYGIKMDKGFEGFEGFGGFGTPIARRQYNDTWDDDRPGKDYFDTMLTLSSNVFIFGGQFFADFLPVNGHWLVWDKLNTMPSFGDCELVWTNVKRNSVKKITVEYNGLLGKEKTRYHPTQKPVSLLAQIILGYTQPGDSILDPFMGSGTTLVAAQNEGRRAVGIELSEEYCNIAVERLRQPSFFSIPRTDNQALHGNTNPGSNSTAMSQQKLFE